MKTNKIILLLFVAFIYIQSSATIINIPDDYVTIQAGIDASIDGDTVLVQPDTYFENIIFNGHNIVLGSLFLTTNDTSHISQTIIDGDSLGSVVTFNSGEDSTAVIIGFTIQNGNNHSGGGIFCTNSSPLIANNIIINNRAEGWIERPGGGISCVNSSSRIRNNIICENLATEHGGGIYCINSDIKICNNVIEENIASSCGGRIYVSNCSDVLISDCKIQDNISFFGGGIYSAFSDASITRNLIYGNISGGSGGGIYILYSNAIVINNLLTFNISDYYNSRGGGIAIEYSNSIIINNILYADSAISDPEIFADSSSTLFVTYNNIQGGWDGEGNIDVNPLFRDPDNGDFHLMSTECDDPYDSPCIDTGHPDILDSLLDCGWGLGTVLSDMGAYGGGDSVEVGIDIRQITLPDQFMLLQNYPNPFNASTIIRYNLPKPSVVAIDIYDILGRKVETLIDEPQQAGYHQAIWNADGFSSGVYFYKLTAGEFVNSKKMVLLK